ncbi:hypothetical protein DdX_20925 [Ditylenchus destructor]|uniref:Uncharacterized protein n=1 Tax=Ditylenchus destructor TaxID=166010 RepID=A0AAD4MGC9_9BILA|nr:hypothetical protein DdX_20925 [Ditylenchus destructor]
MSISLQTALCFILLALVHVSVQFKEIDGSDCQEYRTKQFPKIVQDATAGKTLSSEDWVQVFDALKNDANGHATVEHIVSEIKAKVNGVAKEDDRDPKKVLIFALVAVYNKAGKPEQLKAEYQKLMDKFPKCPMSGRGSA